MRKFLCFAFFALGVTSAASQGGPGNGPGPGPGPQPWRVDGSTISYSNGGVALPASVAGGGKGVGTINALTYYVAGNPLAFGNIAGIVSAAQLPFPTTTTKGAVLSSSAPANQFATGINTFGVVTYAQPAFTNIAGVLASIQLPALAGDVSSSSGSNAVTVSKINGVALGATTATTGHLLVGSGSQWVSVPVTGALTISGAGVATINPNAVSLSQIAQIPTNTVLCNASGASANITACTTLPSGLTVPNWSIAPTPSTLGTALNITETVAGTQATPPYYANPVTINFGALVSPLLPTSTVGNSIYGLGPNCNVVNAGFTGAVACAYSQLNVQAIGTPGFPNDIYTSNFTQAVASVATTDSDAGIWAGNDNVTIALGATGWASITGREVDVTTLEPVTTKFGISIAQGGGDAFQGTLGDAAIFLVNPGNVGWKNLILLDNDLNHTVTGCLICVTNVGALTTVIDLTGWSVSGNVLKSAGITIDGTGSIDAAKIYAGGPDTFGVVFGATVGGGLNFWVVNNTGGVTLEAVNDIPAVIPLNISASLLNIQTTSIEVNGTATITGATCTAWTEGFCTHL